MRFKVNDASIDACTSEGIRAHTRKELTRYQGGLSEAEYLDKLAPKGWKVSALDLWRWGHVLCCPTGLCSRPFEATTSRLCLATHLAIASLSAVSLLCSRPLSPLPLTLLPPGPAACPLSSLSAFLPSPPPPHLGLVLPTYCLLLTTYYLLIPTYYSLLNYYLPTRTPPPRSTLRHRSSACRPAPFAPPAPPQHSLSPPPTRRFFRLPLCHRLLSRFRWSPYPSINK